MVKSVVKSFLPKHTAAEKRENTRKTEILRAFGGRLTRRSLAPKRRALPAAPHPGVKLFGGFVCGLICALFPLLRAVMLKCRGVRGWGFVDKKHRSAASRVCPAGDSRLRPVFRKPVRSWLSPEPCGAFFFFWGEIWDSNPRPSGPQPDALTNCANPTIFFWRALGDSNPRPTA